MRFRRVIDWHDVADDAIEVLACASVLVLVSMTAGYLSDLVIGDLAADLVFLVVPGLAILFVAALADAGASSSSTDVRCLADPSWPVARVVGSIPLARPHLRVR